MIISEYPSEDILVHFLLAFYQFKVNHDSEELPIHETTEIYTNIIEPILKSILKMHLDLPARYIEEVYSDKKDVAMSLNKSWFIIRNIKNSKKSQNIISDQLHQAIYKKSVGSLSRLFSDKNSSVKKSICTDLAAEIVRLESQPKRLEPDIQLTEAVTQELRENTKLATFLKDAYPKFYAALNLPTGHTATYVMSNGTSSDQGNNRIANNIMI
jgi:hypothetical protein